MKDDITTPPAEGVYVYGLYLEGAGWDKRNMRLMDSKPKVLFEMMPVIRIYAENNRENEKKGSDGDQHHFSEESGCYMFYG
ncbi:UNVERIFIED_CONTAM: Dynein heavy chain 5, axonemal [Gekko kuhli]